MYLQTQVPKCRYVDMFKTNSEFKPSCHLIDSNLNGVSPAEEPPPSPWQRAITLAGLLVLGVTPFAHAQFDAPTYPAYCPPLTAFSNATLFDMFWNTTPIRFPYQ